MKALLDHESDEILGFTAVGPHAGEILAVVQTAVMEKLPDTLLRDAVFTHPTMAEGLGPLFSGRPGHRSAAVPIQSPEIGGLRGAAASAVFTGGASD
jgi:pyridine nucleotide-disulfide oxidoreductase